ncbi:hypothetical protein FDA94_36395 [Herbidospora galbida]|uniref:Uncharacterized protein n=1 Tax=Herbidospora galbida TaxID=2575442 RepID=A0A4U3LT73_9ACTN|nr:hypothetical protein [Herbidospora galbida]TKK79000.1 hypothetical protein FDA94_36395 [Herbidospora galbida]
MSDWRFLYETLHDSVDVLWPWLAAHPELVEEVQELGRPDSHRTAPGQDALWRLYAVGRVLDLLIAEHPEVYPAFCAALGADRIDREAFHPFFHEVAEVRQAADPGEPPVIVEERWPGFMVGSLLLARAGVVVTAGERHLVAGVADRSALYWTHRRRDRPARDLSHGWGHNSQWRTGARRDYLVDDRFHYNVDGTERPAGRAEIEVVRHRCSTVTDLGDDLFPYDDHHVEPGILEP